MKWLDKQQDDVVELPAASGLGRQVHVFDTDHVLAVNTAMAAGRPLLLRGEPGTGKSQLARAAAVALGRAFVSKVVDARTEARDLLWTLDAVERLATAQMLGALHAVFDAERSEEDLLARMNYENFLNPGPLWWGFDWDSAKNLPRATAPKMPGDHCSPKNGVVVLIDEIDKADVDVPNGLLEALGNGSFHVPEQEAPVEAKVDPLVVVTTNEERALPDAFLRRCLVLQLGLPEDRDELIACLMRRGAAHFEKLSDEVRRRAAELLVEDRKEVASRGLQPPGQAEYLDLLRVVSRREKSAKKQTELLEQIARFAYQKHPEGELR